MPDWKHRIRERLRDVKLDPAREAEITEELSTHLDDRYRELVSSGVAAADAEGIAAAELETLAIPPRPWPEPLPVGGGSNGSVFAGFWHDLKVAARGARSKPVFSSAVVFMLAVGIAGNAAIFSIFNGLFLRPLPFPEPNRLVDIDETAPKWNLVRVGVSNPDYDSWQKGNTTFERMAFGTGNGANLSDGGVAQRIDGAQVTWNMLSVLGLKPVIGRDFVPEDDKPNAPNVLLLGHDLWRRLYNADPNVLGKTVKLSEQPYTIVGVLPREAVIPQGDAWTTLKADVTRGGSYYLGGIGRLKPGVTMQQAEADLRRVHFTREGMKDAEAYPVLSPVRDRYIGEFKIATRILLGAVGVVLLIACVNIAGLMLVRGESRSREIAIRTAIGASRARVIRQLLTESLLLAVIGGALGVLLGKAALVGLVSLLPDTLPRWVGFSLDGRFALFCAAVTGAAAIVFGLAPALQAAAVDTRGALGESARSTLTRGKRGVLGGLVICEVALAMILLISSALLLQAFRRVTNGDPGFLTDNVITWSLRPAPVKYQKEEQRYAFYKDLLDRLRAVPDVAAASASSHVPLGGHGGRFFQAEGRTPAANEKNPVVLHVTAMSGYLETVGIPVLSGRTLEPRDDLPGAPPVLLVNETFARHFWGHLDVAGKRVRYPGMKDWFTVIGVTRDYRHYGPDQDIRPQVFVSWSLNPTNNLSIAVRTRTDSHAVIAPAREIIRNLDAGLPLWDIRTLDERLNRSIWMRRTYSWLFAAFAVVAVILAAAGIYGVISFAVSQRTREIGIRIALGARPAQVMRGVLTGGMALVAAGCTVGVIGAQFTGRLLTTMLFGVSARDLATYTMVVAALALIGLLANYVPARRAANVEPIRALRSE